MRNLSHILTRFFVHNLLGAAALVTSGCSTTENTELDAVITGAEVHTISSDDNEKTITWIGVKDGKIEVLGSENDVQPTAKSIIDASGEHLYPGFIDAHGHIFGYAETLHTVSLFGTNSLDDCLDRIREFIDRNPEKDWIIGRGWDQNDWPVAEFPTAQDLAEFEGVHLYLTRIDGHAAWVNQKVMDSFEITPGMPITGGQVLNGVLVDMAETLVELPEYTNEFWRAALLQAQDSLVKYGLTAMTDAGLSHGQILLLDSLIEEGKWHLAVNAMISNNEEDLRYFEQHGPIEKPLLSVKSVKAYLDGALGSRGALLRAPYHDLPQHYGLPLLNPAQLDSLRDRCLANDWQLCVHAIGDSAHHVLLESFYELPRDVDLRFRVEHAQIMTPEDSAFYEHPNIVASVQPTHATSDMYWAHERLGEHRMDHAYSYQRILNAAGLVALGTDFPIEHIDPLATFYAATTRKDANEWPEGGFLPEQRLTPEQTLMGMTRDAAYSAFGEKVYGSIRVGQLANFTLLNTNLLDPSSSPRSKTNVTRTILLGKVLYEGKHE